MTRIIAGWFFVFMATGFLCAGEMPGWLTGWKAKGDLRIRYEGFDYDQTGKDNRHRGRFRFRLGAEKKLNDKLTVNFRIATGSGDPTSTNQTFDNTFSGKDLVLDRAFFTYNTGDWTWGAGKFANPFNTTDMVWDSDVNPEGAYGSYSKGLFYLNFGGMVVEEESSSSDINLGAFQAGVSTKGSVQFNGSASYYVYEGGVIINGKDEAYSFFDLLGTVKFKDAPIPMKLSLNFAQNTTSGIGDEDTAYAGYFQLGDTKKPGDWAFRAKYAEIETNSVYALLNDSDFGFTDKKGFVVDGRYQATKYMNWRLAFFSIDSIVAADKGFSRLQIDCGLKF